ncbi:MAG: transposase [Kiritimatiellae bacterium]|nr:transposase [Kiritimatiellia bacterium]
MRRVDARDEGRCDYSASTLLWTVILGFVGHCRSRNAMDALRNGGALPRNILAVSGQRLAAGASPRTACTGTAMRFLGKLPAAVLADIQTALISRLLLAKVFNGGTMRLLGMVAIAVDGTLRERKRGRGLSAKERNRMVLEAKIVTQLGWSITVMSEHLDPWSDEREKQDCEQRAFERLARRLKAAFPRLPVCILGDALYACRPVVGVCAANGWSYVLTAREERTPTMMAAARKAADRRGPAALGGGRSGEVRWATDDEIGRETGDATLGTVIFVHERDGKGGDLYKGAFVTDLPVLKAGRAVELADWGRRRWNIENGFHTLKGEDGFGLEHSFCNDERAGENMHTLMTIAHTLWQLLHSGYLKRLGRGFRKVQQVNWAELVREALRFGALDAEDLDAALGARRMRFQIE